MNGVQQYSKFTVFGVRPAMGVSEEHCPDVALDLGVTGPDDNVFWCLNSKITWPAYSGGGTRGLLGTGPQRGWLRRRVWGGMNRKPARDGNSE